MKYTLFFLALTIAVSTIAQPITTGNYGGLEPPKAYFDIGYNDCNFAISYNGTSKKVVDRQSLRFGLMFEFAMSKLAYFELGVLYVFNGCDTPLSGSTKTLLLHNNTIEVPLNIMFKTGRPGQTRLFAGGGAVLNFYKDGTILRNTGDDNLNIGSDANYDFKNFGLSIDCFAGVRLMDRYQVRFTYELEMLNLSPDVNNKGSIHYNVLAVTVHKFKNKKKSPSVYKRELYYPRL